MKTFAILLMFFSLPLFGLGCNGAADPDPAPVTDPDTTTTPDDTTTLDDTGPEGAGFDD